MQETDVRSACRWIASIATLFAAPAFTLAPSLAGPPTVAVSTSLVRVDLSVNDHAGKAVLDLKPSDFEVREEGRLQAITHFLVLGPGANDGIQADATPPANTGTIVALPQADATGGSMPATAGTPAVPASATRPPQGRQVVFVIDDLSLSNESLMLARPVLAEVLGRLAPGDAAAIVRASALPKQLVMSSDMTELRRLAEALRWNVVSARARSVDPIEVGLLAQALANARLPTKPGEEIERELDAFHVKGTLAALEALANGLAALPGRKALVLLSDSLKMQPVGRDLYERLGDATNRASVSVYSLDTRGVQPLNLAADDFVNVPGATPRIIRDELANRQAEYTASQSGMRELAEQTGGLFLRDTSLRRGLERVLEDTRVYYILGFSPATGGGGPRLRRIEVKVKRHGCRVRARHLYYG